MGDDLVREPAVMRRDRAPALCCGLVAGLVVLALLGARTADAEGAPTHGAGGFGDSVFVRGEMTPPPPYRPKEFAFIYDQGVFHIFYMRHNRSVTDDETELDIGHAVSTDLFNWTQLDSVMHVQPGTWDSSHVWAPTIIKRNGTWYMFYAGVANQPYPWNWYQKLGVATSTDLMHWTHYDEPVWSGNQVPWALADSSKFDGAQFRDPFVMDDPDHPGQWLMYYVTEAAALPGQLLIAAARSDGGLSPWHDVGPMWCSTASRYWGWCESPHLVKHGDLWFLFATTESGHPIGFRTASNPLADTTEWNVRYRLYDYASTLLRNSDAWFASEVLSVGGHDYFAYVDSDDNVIGIEELNWGTPPDFFSLGPPTLPVTSVAPAARTTAAGMRLVGRARRGAGALLAVSQLAAGPVRLELFDVTGRRVRVLHTGALPAGESLVRWDGRGESGAALPCAIYFARAVTRTSAPTVRVPLTD